MQQAKTCYSTKLAAQAALLALVACAAVHAAAQEPSSSSAPAAQSVPNTPAAALRNALSAACSQSDAEFARFLTPRNAQSFARLTGAARVALMKRLVLLDEPGKPSVSTNPSGRATVRCETPLLTTEMQIGGADTQENLAFLPLIVRNASDAAGAGARQIQIGLVRDAGGWKLLSVGLLLLDLPALEIEWNRATMDANERDAVQTLKDLARAIEAYRRTYTKLPQGLVNLGQPARGAVSAASAGLADAELAAGTKSGYVFRYVIVGAETVGAQAKYELAATPLVYGTTGRRSFFRDAEGVIHGADRQGALASPSDPHIE